ncbi:aryl-sulfate sulfotransferase [candidate division KSB1 bacterium]|nr:aryl-sulfate sulfotransferase [candidate division KSB1 bacterium]
MKLFYSCLIFAGVIWGQQMPAELLYQYPLPNSLYVSRSITILTRFRKDIQVNDDVLKNLFVVSGDQNGVYATTVYFSDDRETIICKPDKNFALGETITVTLTSPLLSQSSFSYKFNITNTPVVVQKNAQAEHRRLEYGKTRMENETMGHVKTINGVSVPGDFPIVSVLADADGKAPGRLFTAFRQSYFMILENDGTPYFYRKSNDFLMDFKIQPNGQLSRSVDDRDTDEHFFVTMDHHYEYVDSFFVKHGYLSDHHDFLLLPNGHSLFICDDFQPVDMSQIVEGGKTGAVVLGNIIQEQDSNNDVVFEWRVWDFISFTDCLNEDITAQRFILVHINSITPDDDGHYLISCRNLSQCIKINRDSGDIIW